MRDVLLLNADYAPVQVLCWERAVCMLLAQKVRTVQPYPGRTVRSASVELPWPAVVSLVRYARVRHPLRLGRAGILARDAHTCQYCGVAPRSRAELTIDHVVPRARAVAGSVTLPGGRRVAVTSWENCVAACRACNGRKGARTPDEARMPLRATPRRPDPGDAVRLALARGAVPEEWREFLSS